MSAENNSSIKYKVAYIHGRPQSHPMQMKCAEALQADFYPVDFKIRWHDRPEAGKFRKYFSWVVCAFTFPEVKKYDVFLAGGLHATMPLMRLFGVIKGKQKIVVHLGDHSLYFLYCNLYPSRVKRLLLFFLSKYDAIICEGKKSEYYVQALLGDKAPLTYSCPSAIPAEHYSGNKNIQPDLNSKKILFMGRGPNANRLFYKGLDLIVEAFSLIAEKDPELELIVVGDWDNDVIDRMLLPLKKQTKEAIKFVGDQENLAPFLEESALYLHCARGEAFGVTIVIAMLAGLIPIVSEYTGAREAVEPVSEKLIVPLDAHVIAERTLWFFSLSLEEKRELSEVCRNIASNYTEENMLNKYKEVFEAITRKLFSPDKKM